MSQNYADPDFRQKKIQGYVQHLTASSRRKCIHLRLRIPQPSLCSSLRANVLEGTILVTVKLTTCN